MLLMSIKEYAESRNVNDKVLRKLIAEGKISAGRVGRKWLLDVAKVDAYFEELTTPKPIPQATKGFDFMAALNALKKRAVAV